VLTGHVLKDTDAIVGYHLTDEPRHALANRPISVPAELGALKKVLDDAVQG
jgi:hypothetical protein